MSDFVLRKRMKLYLADAVGVTSEVLFWFSVLGSWFVELAEEAAGRA